MLSRVLRDVVLAITIAILFVPASANGQDSGKLIRIGIIGLDTSHSVAFTKSLNEGSGEDNNFRVVVAYPHGSADIESSVSRIPKYTEQVESLGVKIVDSIDELIAQVDAVLLETNDAHVHEFQKG